MIKSLIAGAFLLLTAQSASAAVITVAGNFIATDWTVSFGTPAAPIDPLRLNYSATFDTSLTYIADTSVTTVFSTNIPYAFTFSYEPGNVIVLATFGAPAICNSPASSICVAVVDFETGIPFFVQQSPASGGVWTAQTITGSFVPEPGSWLLMIAGFGLVGSALRWRTASRAIG